MEREPVKVYSKENCVQCDATYRKLGKQGIKYEVIMLETVPDKLEEFKEMGFMGAPVVVTENDIWSGFRPDKIASIE